MFVILSFSLHAHARCIKHVTEVFRSLERVHRQAVELILDLNLHEGPFPQCQTGAYGEDYKVGPIIFSTSAPTSWLSSAIKGGEAGEIHDETSEGRRRSRGGGGWG